MAFVSRRPAEPIPDRFEIATDRGVVEIDLRRHPRARNYTLRIAGPSRAAVLTMPKRGTVHEARRFLERHTPWLKRQIEKLPAATEIADGATIAFRGVPHVIRHAPATRGVVHVATDIAGTAIVVPTPDIADSGQVRRRVVEFLKREAKRDLEWAVIRHALTLGVRAKSIRVRDQVSRWGSCSADGHLSFSWRLVMAPPAVLDYLAAHEVAHLAELNHSPRFWRLCERLAPQSSAARAWLRKNGAALHAIATD